MTEMSSQWNEDPMLLRDRREAGRRLADHLLEYRGRPDVLVLGLPRGGVPVAFEVARALHAPLDVLVVRKLGLPGHEELAVGAIASGGILVLNPEFIEPLGVPMAFIRSAAAREQAELKRRERLFRDGRSAADPAGRTVILVDDGLATGATMRAAIKALRERNAAAIVVAVPVALESTCRELEPLADRVVCLIRPRSFGAVGEWYLDFGQTSDPEVRTLLDEAQEARAAVAQEGATGALMFHTTRLPIRRRRNLMTAEFGFSAEYAGSHPAYDGFDEYLRIEFAKRHPGWEPRFGTATWFDPVVNRYDHMYLLTGNVPEAQSQSEAENKVRDLLEEIANRFKSLRPKTEKALPKPNTRVWSWRS